MIQTPAPFDTLFQTRRRALYALAFQRLGSAADAEDAVQDTYLKCRDVAWGAVQSPEAMLTRIHLNVIHDIRRRRRRSVELADADGPEAVSVPAAAPDPEETLLARRRLRAAQAGIDALPPVCRRVFTLCRIDGLSHADISAATGLSRPAVEKHIVRAMQRLRRSIRD
ncbi:RNA polymerase sigma factor [Rhodocista pekingensis]|uniref:RNA polymerase sigma factor n=1 Tax=Rhodocista pekingensis TaxID=201185 RepID=A0ABW2L0P4_9PROT